MGNRYVIAIALMLAFLFGSQAVAGQKIGLDEKAALQAALMKHIDRQTVDGEFLYLDTSTGEVHALYPGTTHPMVLGMGEHFVLCYNFRDDKGNLAEVDFYLAKRDQSYVVFHTAVNNRGILESLMKDGKVERLD